MVSLAERQRAFFVDEEIQELSPFKEIPTSILIEANKRLPDEEFNRFNQLQSQLTFFDHWLNQVGDTPWEKSSLETEFLPRQFMFDSANIPEPSISFPPALPFLEGVFSSASLAFQKYQSLRLSQFPDFNKAALCLQTTEGLTKALELIQQMGKGEVKWQGSSWVTSTDGFLVYKDAVTNPYFIEETYYTPGRDRFAVRWWNGNPKGSRPKPDVLLVEVRLDPARETSFAKNGQLNLDFSVRQIAVRAPETPKGMAWYSKASEELTDFVFGPGIHHLSLARGNYQECVRLVCQTMTFLNVGHLIKEVPTLRLKRKG